MTDHGVSNTVGPLHWQEQALCLQVGADEWFPEQAGSTAAAKKVCRQCPVTAQCLALALRNDEQFGVFGGLSVQERRKLQGKKPKVKPSVYQAGAAGYPCPEPDCGRMFKSPMAIGGHRNRVHGYRVPGAVRRSRAA